MNFSVPQVENRSMFVSANIQLHVQHLNNDLKNLFPPFLNLIYSSKKITIYPNDNKDNNYYIGYYSADVPLKYLYMIPYLYTPFSILYN